MPLDPLNELLLHLDYVPFLEIPFEFSPGDYLKEARSLRDHFEPYKAGTSHWRTAALRSPGGDPGNPKSRLREKAPKDTALAPSATKSIKFLKRLLQWEKTNRVRFMLLEAGGKIGVHRDSDESTYFFSINISLNMPKGCEFWTDLNPDGTKNTFSKKVPFKNSGSIFLMNNAKYHLVDNRSKLDRFHVAAIGPLSMSTEKLLKLARKQNKCTGPNDVVSKLLRKKDEVNETILRDSPLVRLLGKETDLKDLNLKRS